MRSQLNRFRRAREITWAFVRMSASEQFAYPIGILTMAVGWVIGPTSAHFVSQLVPSQPSVGNDYFTFVMISILAGAAANAGLSAFGGQLDTAMSTGRLENLLVEPLRWRLLPFGLAGWPVIFNSGIIVFQFFLGLAFGMTIRFAGLLPATVILVGAMAAGHAIGVLSASIKILAKRSDPLLTLYNILTGLFSGAVFPVDLLPVPLRVVSYMLPQTYVLTAARRVLMPDGASIAGPSALQATLMLSAFLLVVYPLGIWLFGRALEEARRIGTLAGY